MKQAAAPGLTLPLFGWFDVATGSSLSAKLLFHRVSSRASAMTETNSGLAVFLGFEAAHCKEDNQCNIHHEAQRADEGV